MKGAPPLGICPPWCDKPAGHDWEDQWKNGPVRFHNWRTRIGTGNHWVGVEEIEQHTTYGVRLRQRRVVLDVESPTDWDVATAGKAVNAIAWAFSLASHNDPGGVISDV